MTRNQRRMSLALFLSLGTLARAVAAADDGVRLAYVYQAKSTTSYTIEFDTRMLGEPVHSSRVIRERVNAIDGNGRVIMLVTDAGGETKIGKIRREMPGGSAVTKTLDRNGMLVDYKQEHSDTSVLAGSERLVATLSSVILPRDLVKVGDSWRTEVASPIASGDQIAVTTTLVAMEGDTAHLRQTASAAFAADAKPSTIEVEAWLGADGRLVRLTQSARDVPTTFGMIDWTMSQTLRPASEHP